MDSRFSSMKRILLFACILAFISPSQAQFDKILKKGRDILENPGGAAGGEKTGMALKEALNIGVEKAVQSLSAENGYFGSPYKILVPKEAQQVISKVKRIPGFQDVDKKLIRLMNDAAELAVKKATPIFVSAIKQMTFTDAVAILRGENNAATNYLRKTTHQNLYDSFLPIIRNSLEEVNALSYWKTVVTAYNKIPLTKPLNPELDDHVNQKALVGLYSLVEKKEAGIRTDVKQRTSDLLREVFGKG